MYQKLRTYFYWKKFNIEEDAEEILDISNIDSEAVSANKIYTLSGKRLTNPQKGIVIINGKKVVVK